MSNAIQQSIPAATQNKILGTIRNQFNAAEGSLLPPPQNGTFRVPFVTGLAVQNTVSFVGGTQFTLVFNTPPNISNVDHYNIYVSGLTGNPNDFQGPASAASSPATVRVSTVNAQRITFKVQTVLSNGLQSNLQASPSCTGSTIAATISGSDIPDGSLTLEKLAAEPPGSLITFAVTTGIPTLISPVASGGILVSNGTTTPPVYLAPGAAGQVLASQGPGVTPHYINVPTVLFVETAVGTVANTGTETSVVGTGVGSMTLPANFFTTGRSVKLYAAGFHSATGGTTLQVKVKAGSVTLLDSGVVNIVNATSNGWNLDALITCYTTGGSGTFWAQGSYSNLGPVANVSFPLFRTATATVDTTVTELVDITVTWGTASSSNTITSTNLYLQSLN